MLFIAYLGTFKNAGKMTFYKFRAKSLLWPIAVSQNFGFGEKTYFLPFFLIL